MNFFYVDSMQMKPNTAIAFSCTGLVNTALSDALLLERSDLARNSSVHAALVFGRFFFHAHLDSAVAEHAWTRAMSLLLHRRSYLREYMHTRAYKRVLAATETISPSAGKGGGGGA